MNNHFYLHFYYLALIVQNFCTFQDNFLSLFSMIARSLHAQTTYMKYNILTLYNYLIFTFKEQCFKNTLQRRHYFMKEAFGM
jgi:hypothetical protein